MSELFPPGSFPLSSDATEIAYILQLTKHVGSVKYLANVEFLENVPLFAIFLGSTESTAKE